MAPRKRSNEEKEAAKPELPTRMTRSAARQASDPNPANTVDELPKKKKAKKAVKKVQVAEERSASDCEEEDKANGEPSDESKTKTIVIEHCKQCNSFKTRANQVKEGLEKDVSGITVLVNPDKPRRGCFEIREEGGEKFISLLEMKRPFGPMKALDMGQVISDIIDKVK